MDKIVLRAPAEGVYGGYRAQEASGLRVDAFPADVPALLAQGFVLGEEANPVDQPVLESVLAESSDVDGGFAA